MVESVNSDIGKGGKPFGAIEKHFLSDIYSESELIAQGVKSKLVLNEIEYTEPMILLYPSTNGEFRDIIRCSELRVKGYSVNAGGKRTEEVDVPRGYRANATHRQYFTSWNEYLVEMVPEEVYRRCYIGDQNEDGSHILFFLTDSNILQPLVERCPPSSPTEIVPNVILSVMSDWTARFEKHYTHIHTRLEEINGCFSSGHLVLTLERDNSRPSSIDEIHKISDLVSELLWYLSFASRQRTTWVRWEGILGADYVQYYRRISIPEKADGYEELISEHSIQEFLQHCMEYIGDENNIDLYLPIIYLVNSYNPRETLESKFLSAFMSLEALLNLCAEHRSKSKYIEDKMVWREFRSRIETIVREIPHMDSKSKDGITNRVGNLNQISLKTLYDHFCEEKGIINLDLWPVFASSDKCRSLYDIRNALVHGKRRRRFEYNPFLSIARDHLQWTVDRCILAVLGWNKPTNVDRECASLSRYPNYSNWIRYFKMET